MRRHTPRLVHGLTPGVLHHPAFADGLGEPDTIGLHRLMLIDVVEYQPRCRHGPLPLQYILRLSIARTRSIAIGIFYLCAKIVGGNCNPLAAKERKLIEVAALKNDLIVA